LVGREDRPLFADDLDEFYRIRPRIVINVFVQPSGFENYAASNLGY
jgi:hypothetical protein